MKRKTMIAALLIAAVAVLAAAGMTAFSQQRGQQQRGQGMGGGMGMGGPGGGQEMIIMRQVMGLNMLGRLVENPRVKESLGLTDAQIALIKEKSESSKQAMKTATESRKAIVAELAELLQANKPDISKIDAKIDALAKIETQQKKDMLHSALEIKAALTVEQLEMLKKFEQQQRNRGGQGRGRQGGGPGMRGGGGMGGPNGGMQGGNRGMMPPQGEQQGFGGQNDFGGGMQPGMGPMAMGGFGEEGFGNGPDPMQNFGGDPFDGQMPQNFEGGQNCQPGFDPDRTMDPGQDGPPDDGFISDPFAPDPLFGF